MRCPYCHHAEDKVIDSREAKDGMAIRRRRECERCGRRFTTYEYIEEIPLMIIKKDGRREPFSREKLLAGIQKACEKRPVATETIESMVNEIIAVLTSTVVQEIPSSRIGELVMKRLRNLDHVAYVRFASVYQEFKDTEDFLSELQALLGKKRKKRNKK
ncbi:MAG: transcriptional regulator NrdR [bacterium]|nr:transcriptional regulator NrdR [bacterium]